MKLLTIQKAAKFLKVSPNTLRRWEESGKLLPQRSESSYRLYNLEDLKKFKRHTLNSKTFQTKNITPVEDYQTRPTLQTATQLSSVSEKAPVESANQLMTRNTQALNIQSESPKSSPKSYNTTLPKPLANNLFVNSFLASLLIFAIGSGFVLFKSINTDQNISKPSNQAQFAFNDLNDNHSAQEQSGVLAATAIAQILTVNTDTAINGNLKVSSFESTGSATIGGSLNLTALENQIKIGNNITINASGISSSFTANFPNISGSDDFVFADTAQTLTNKTISGSSNTLTNIPNSALTNSSITVSAGTGMAGGGTVSLGGSVTLNNAGVTSLTGGTDISVSASTGSVTVSDSSTLSSVTGRGASTSTPLSLLGNVGIGTSNSTTAVLDIYGGGIHINSSTPSNTSDLLYQTSDTLFWNGNSVAIGGSISGTTNQIAYFTSSNSVGSSVISQNGSNIGIGSTNAGAALSVYGGLSVGTSYFTTAPPGDGAIIQGNVGIGTNNPNTAALAVIGGNIGVGTTTPGYAISVVGTSNITGAATFGAGGAFTGNVGISTTTIPSGGQLYVNGNVGIGTSTPSQALAVVGTINVTGLSASSGVYTDSSKNLTSTVPSSGTIGFWNRASTGILSPATIGDNVGIGTSSNTNKLEVNGSAAFGTYVGTAAPTNGVIISGNLGVGTSNPAATLHVNSSATGSTNGIRITFPNVGGDYDRGFIGLVPFASTDYFGFSSNGTTKDMAIGTDAAKALRLFTNNTERLSILSGGNVGIGTTIPAQKLHVIGDGAFSGNIGIGTTLATSPGGFAQVATIYGAATASLSIYGGASNRAEFGVSSFGGWLSTADSIPLRFATNGTEQMRIDAGGNVGIGTTAATDGALVVYRAGANADIRIKGITTTYGLKADDGAGAQLFSLTRQANNYVSLTGLGGIGFVPNSGAQSASYKMVIDSGGNIGIGTTNPTSVLEIYGSGLMSRISSETSGSSNSIFFSVPSGVNSDANQVASIRGIVKNTSSATPLQGSLEFRTNSGDNAAITMYIDESGNVGIGGTSTPIQKLHVAGNGYFTGNVGIGTATANGTFETYGTNNLPRITAGSGYAGLTLYSTSTLKGSFSFAASAGQFATGSAADDITIANNSSSARIVFGTGSGPTARMVIDAVGNVGIGTTLPISTQSWGKIVDLTGTGSTAYRIHGGGTTQETGMGSDGAGLYIDASGHATSTNNIIVFRTEETNSAFTPTERMRIDLNGNVGIGTASPTVGKLMVNGTINIVTGNLGFGTTGNAVLRLSDNVNTVVNPTTTGGAVYLNWDRGTVGTIFGDGSAVEQARLSSGGNLGLSTTTTSYKLNVNGTANISGVATYGAGSSFVGNVGINTTTVPTVALYVVGSVGIGTSSNNHTLQVAGSIGPSVTNAHNLGSSGFNWGCLFYNNSQIGSCASDVRLKQNIANLSFDNTLSALDQVNGLQIRTYEFISAPGNTYHGLIAQEVELVAPELVTTGADGFKKVSYGDIQWLTLQAIQQLSSQTAAKYKLDSNGVLEIPQAKIGKLILDPDLDTSGTANDNGTLSYQLDNIQTQQTDLASAVSDLDSAVAGISATSADLATNIATNSAELASAQFDISQIKQDVADLKLTPPDVLIATESATFAHIDVTEKVSTLDLASTGVATFSGSLKALGDTFLGNTTIAGDLSQDGTLSISSGNSINAIATLYLQNSPLATNLDIFQGKVKIDNTGLIAAVTVQAEEYKVIAGKSSGTATISSGQSNIEIANAYITSSSRILITPTTQTSQVLAVTAKTPGQKFEVSASSPPSTDLSFDYWIINEVTN